MSIGWDVGELLAERDAMRKKLADRDHQLAIARDAVARLEGEALDLGTRLKFAQITTMASTRTAYVALARLQLAADVADRARVFLGGRTHNQITEMGARPLLDASYAYEALLRNAS